MVTTCNQCFITQWSTWTHASWLSIFNHRWVKACQIPTVSPGFLSLCLPDDVDLFLCSWFFFFPPSAISASWEKTPIATKSAIPFLLLTFLFLGLHFPRRFHTWWQIDLPIQSRSRKESVKTRCCCYSKSITLWEQHLPHNNTLKPKTVALKTVKHLSTNSWNMALNTLVVFCKCCASGFSSLPQVAKKINAAALISHTISWRSISRILNWIQPWIPSLIYKASFEIKSVGRNGNHM